MGSMGRRRQDDQKRKKQAKMKVEVEQSEFHALKEPVQKKGRKKKDGGPKQ